ncbi:MAG TPA: radical SAM protein [Elusimicrobiales bacterium]|nr:radical SAM protein [Elusimicrobiales bacterium]
MNKKADVALFLSPCSLMLTVPELGIPQLAAYLRARGRRVGALDLNALFLSAFLKKASARALLKRRFSLRRPPGSRLRDIDLKGTPWGPECVDGDTAAIDDYTALLGLEQASWSLDDVLAAASRPDALYDLFFEQYVAPAAAGAPLAGFSILTHQQLPPALYFARKLKARFPEMRICFGGPWCTASRPVIGKWPELFGAVDAVVFYGGEAPLDGLINHCRGRTPLAKVPGLAYLDKGQVKLTPPAKGPDIGALPPPDFDPFDLSLYTRRMLPYQTSSGCAWGRCTFCYHCFPDNSFRMKAPETVAAQVEQLKRRHGVTHFWFADLAVPFRMLDRLSRLLIAGRTGVLWTAMARADDRFTPELARQLYSSGCTNILFGLETSDPEALVRIRKGLTPETFERCARVCSAAGICVSVFLLDYPGQSAAQFKTTVKYAENLRDSISDIIIAKFELGRASNSMRHLDELEISLPPGSDRDTRSFSLPYSVKKQPAGPPPRPAESLRLRDSRRPGKEILLLRPPSLRVCAPPGLSPLRADEPVLRGSLPLLQGLARQFGAIHSRPTRVMDFAAPGSAPEPGPVLRCGNFKAEGAVRETRWAGLPEKEMRAALRGCRPEQILISSGFVHDYPGVHRVLNICKELFPGIPLTVGGPYATLCPEHARAAGAGRVFSGLFYNTGTGGAAEPGAGAVWLARGCACGRGDCAVAALEGPLRRERDFSLLLAEAARCALTAADRRVPLLGTASLCAPNAALERLLEEFPLRGRAAPDLPEGLPCAALTARLAALLARRKSMPLRLLPASGRAAGLKSELKAARRLLDSAGFPRSRSAVMLTLGGPGQSAGELEALAGVIEACGFTVEPLLYAPAPGTPDFPGRNPGGKTELAELNPLLWPLASKKLTVAQLDALLKKFSRG